MKIKIVTPLGGEYSEENCTYILIHDEVNGSFGMLNNHLPLISTVKIGYVAVTKENKDIDYIALSSAVVRNLDDSVSVTCESIAFGKTKDEAMIAFHNLLDIRREENRERNVELALAENTLKKEIKKTGAGHL